MFIAEKQELEPFIKWIEIVVCICNAKAPQMLDYIRFYKITWRNKINRNKFD